MYNNGALNLQEMEFATKGTCGGEICKEYNLQEKGVEIARNGKCKKRPQNSQLCELAKKGIFNKRNLRRWNLQGIQFARKRDGNCKKWKMQGKAPKFATL